MHNTDIKHDNQYDNWLKKIIFFLSGQTVSLFGSALVQYAIIWHVTLVAKSGFMMTISTLCGFLPQLVISLFGGVWADRHNRKKLIILADLSIASSTLVLAILFIIGYEQLWFLFLISAIRSLGAGIQTPAVSAVIPQIVPEDKLMKINGINASIQSLTMLIAPAVSGALLAEFSLASVFFADVVTAIIAVAILCFIRIPSHKKALEGSTNNATEDLKEGIRYIKNSVFLSELIVFFSIFLFLIVPAAFLTPLLITRVFGDEVWRLTVNEIAFSAGSIIGGIVISVWGGFKKKVFTIAVSCIWIGITTIALGFANIFTIYLIVVFLCGISLPLFNSPMMTLMQEKVEINMQGRVFSLVSIVSTAAMPFGMVLFGPAADIINIEWLLIVTGILLSALGCSIFFNKRFIESSLEDINSNVDNTNTQ